MAARASGSLRAGPVVRANPADPHTPWGVAQGAPIRRNPAERLIFVDENREIEARERRSDMVK
ncbi:MAG TPA: hypothetical protein VFM45_06205, partial [Anaeromyxobacteraceae bacterium]|nr:hypothetical protein [Anaeromyxobacteraceae bacterium]